MLRAGLARLRSPTAEFPREPWRPTALRSLSDVAPLWAECRALARAIRETGGVIVETPEPVGRHDGVVARTVIQPDGDILYLVRASYRHRPDIAAAHAQRVRAWFDTAEAKIAGLAALIRVSTAGAGIGIGAAGSALAVVATGDALTLGWSILTGAGTFAAVGVIGQAAVGAVLRLALRGLLGRVARP